MNIFLASIEVLFNLEDTELIFHLRHFITFFIFFIGCIVLYKLLQKRYKNTKIALLGCLFFICCPRFFAESFYNSKDVLLLSFHIIALYFLYLYIHSEKIKHLILFSLIASICIDIRIIGMIIPPIGAVVLCIKYLQNPNWKKFALHLGVLLVSTLVFTIIFWPLLWEKPFKHFAEAYQTMSHIFWAGKVLFMGTYYQVPEQSLPWYYVPVWIFVSTPILNSVLFLIASIITIVSLFSNKLTKKISNELVFDVLLIFLFLGIIGSVIAVNGTIYDGWRHLYFTYAPVLILSVSGLNFIINYSAKKSHQYVVYFILSVSFLTTIIDMIRLHPYQNVYFNTLAGNNLRHDFELDYWRLSYLEGLKYIAKIDGSKKIKVFIHGNTSVGLMLPKKDRERFECVNDTTLGCKYLLANYRYHREYYAYKNKIYDIVLKGDTKIMTVFNIENE
ncbi:MAG: hypothetical protein EAZ53_15330 [Bacteroidetes bacterium]|nr:MAG: hypothetical protein EAZ53_15330 [Bacteroidota bacterium]